MKRLLTAAAILGLVAFMLPATAGIALAVDPVAPGTVNLLKVVDGGSALPSDFDIGLNPGFGEVGLTLGGPYHSGDSVAVIPGTYLLFESYDGGGYYEESITCTNPDHATVSEVPAPGSLVNDQIGLNVTVAAGEVWNCTITNTNVPPATATPTPTPTPTATPTEPSAPASLDISFTDCTVATGEGAIIVTGFNDPIQKLVVTPGDLVITKDGTYPLAPGEYSWQYTAGHWGGGGDDFTIGACPQVATIRFHKVVVNEFGGTMPPAAFDLLLTNGDGSVAIGTFHDDGSTTVAPGTYKLWESSAQIGMGAPYKRTGTTCKLQGHQGNPLTSPGALAFTVAAGEVWDCTVTNQYTAPPPSPSPSASPSPSPTPTPVASPTPKPTVTPTPKPTSATLPAEMTPPPTTIGASTGGSSSPLVPISIALLLVAATGLMLTRRPKSR